MEKKTEGRRSWSSRRRMRIPFSTPMTKGRSSACARKTNFSLLDRLRDAVLRLIMLSALSKAATATPPPPPQERNLDAQRSTDCRRHYPYPYHHHHEPHRSEALADCIEFMKKSATAADVEICGAAAEDDGSSRM